MACKRPGEQLGMTGDSCPWLSGERDGGECLVGHGPRPDGPSSAACSTHLFPYTVTASRAALLPKPQSSVHVAAARPRVLLTPAAGCWATLHHLFIPRRRFCISPQLLQREDSSPSAHFHHPEAGAAAAKSTRERRVPLRQVTKGSARRTSWWGSCAFYLLCVFYLDGVRVCVSRTGGNTLHSNNERAKPSPKCI